MIVSLGDLLLDVIVRLRQPLAEGADADAITQLGPGGQAANVAAWVAELGGKSRFVGKRADDEAGGIAARGLERYGVEVRGPVVEGRTGTVVALVAEDGARTMASDPASHPTSRSASSNPRGSRAARTSTFPATRSCARRSTTGAAGGRARAAR